MVRHIFQFAIARCGHILRDTIMSNYNMNLAFHISDDGSKLELKYNLLWTSMSTPHVKLKPPTVEYT